MSNKFYTVEKIHELLTKYDASIISYISTLSNGKGFSIYNNYSELPNNLTEDTVAYCKYDYKDNTNVNNPIVYSKGLYFYDSANSKWSILPLYATVDLSEIEEAVESLSFNKIDRDELHEYLDKDTYMSEINEGNVKCADKSKTLEGTELAKPFQFWGVNSAGEAKYQYLPLSNTDPNCHENFEQRELINVTANDIFEIESINHLADEKVYVLAYKIKQGEKNINSTLKEFNIAHKDEFYHDDNIIFNEEGLQIKTKYKYNILDRSNGFSETEVINKNDFIELYRIEVN